MFLCLCPCLIFLYLQRSCQRGFPPYIFLYFQIKVCSSTTSTRCEGIHEISEKLKNVSSKGKTHIVEDIKLTVDVVEKIVTHVDLSNIEKAPKVRKS